MAGELARVKASYSQGQVKPQVQMADVIAIAAVAETAIDYMETEAVIAEAKGGTVAQKNTLRLAYMNLKLRADALR